MCHSNSHHKLFHWGLVVIKEKWHFLTVHVIFMQQKKEPVRGTINRDKAKYSRGIIGNLHFNVNHTIQPESLHTPRAHHGHRVFSSSHQLCLDTGGS